ncbi:MAG: DUF3313 family protein [Hyphomonadaceae bacterium]
MTSLIKRALAFTAATTMVAAAAQAAPFDAIDRATDAPLYSYEKVYIAPVETDFSEHPVRRSTRDLRGFRPISERDQARKASDFAEELQSAFGKKYLLVDAPGDGILTIEATLTKLVSTRPTIADARSRTGLSFSSLYVGGADYQINLIEGSTLLTRIEEKQSNNSNLNDGLPRVGIWADADRSFDRFARQLARYVENN